MSKIDFKKVLKPLYGATNRDFVLVEVPALNFLKIDGAGDPNQVDAYREAVEWLYSLSYGLKFAAKSTLTRDYVVPPLEGLWWADDPTSFVSRDKDKWFWTMMIMAPDFITADLYDQAKRKTITKRGAPPASLRLESLEEGLCLQALHLGSYDDEGPLLAKLHHEIMPSQGLTFNGPHHEIYLGDPRKTEPSRLKTILRQPVKPLNGNAPSG